VAKESRLTAAFAHAVAIDTSEDAAVNPYFDGTAALMPKKMSAALTLKRP